MRILLFSHEFLLPGRESGDALFHLLKGYAKNPNLKVDVITSSFDKEKHLFKLGENISIYRLPVGKEVGNINYQSNSELDKYAHSFYEFSKQLTMENEYDLSHSFFTIPCGITSMLLKKKLKIPYIISLRGPDVPNYDKPFNKSVNETVKKIWQDAQFIIANNQGLREIALKNDPNKKISVIYDGIDINGFFPDQNKKDENKFIILCVSDIIPEKGIRSLIQAFGVLSGRYNHIRLVIVGDGEERSSLENLVRALEIEDKVVFMGAVPHEKVPEYYQKSDLFVLPTLEDRISNSMFEAMACGLPVVTTDTRTNREILKENINCLIAKRRDTNDLEEKIEAFLLNSNIGREMGKKNIQSAAEQFSWEAIAKKYLDIYTETTKY